LAALVEQVDQIADKYELDSSSLIDILALTDPTQQDEMLSELLPNASDRDKAKLYRIIEEVNPILQRRQELFDNVEAASKEAALLEETKNKQELYEKVKLRENITRNVVERITEKLPFVKNISGLDISSIQQKAAQTDPTVIHPVDFAYNAVSAQILPAIVREYNSQKKEIESLTDRLAEYENAEPKISGSSPTRTATGLYSSGNSGAVEGNFIDAINKAFGS
jgi:predicted nuclease with TOPRIM domain